MIEMTKYQLIIFIIGFALLMVALVVIPIVVNDAQPGQSATDLAETPPAPPEFHIKLVSGENEYWHIIFTNDNFVTEHKLLEVGDYSADREGTLIIKASYMTKDKQKAIEVAKSLNSFDDCLAYNRKVDAEERRLIEYRKKFPVEKKEEPPKKAPQEILIK